jgi:mannosyltransferase OCH1-like enzyme
MKKKLLCIVKMLLTIFIALFIIIIIVIVLSVGLSRSENFQNKSKTLSYQEFKELYPQEFDPIVQVSIKQRTIPKIVFRTGPFKLTSAPEVMKEYLQKLVDQNPGYTQVYFDDDDCRNFINDYFPEYLPEYDVLIPGAFKADLWRALVIYKYGGIYNDIGHKYITPIDEIVTDQDNIIFCTDDEKLPLRGIHNAFFASYPKSEIIKHVLKTVITNIRNRSYGIGPLSITGPNAWLVGINKYLNRNINSPFNRGTETDDWGNQITFVEFIDYKWKDPRNHIINTRGTKCILSKFPDYYNVMYDNRNVKHYAELWHNRQVYK